MFCLVASAAAAAAAECNDGNGILTVIPLACRKIGLRVHRKLRKVFVCCNLCKNVIRHLRIVFTCSTLYFINPSASTQQTQVLIQARLPCRGVLIQFFVFIHCYLSHCSTYSAAHFRAYFVQLHNSPFLNDVPQQHLTLRHSVFSALCALVFE